MQHISAKCWRNFVREFPWLVEILGYECVKSIKVQRVSLRLLQESAVSIDLWFAIRKVFYAVYGEQVRRLEANIIYNDDDRPNVLVPSNGAQIFQIGLGPPDFIVEKVEGFTDEGSHERSVTVYKANKFNWDGYFKECEAKITLNNETKS